MVDVPAKLAARGRVALHGTACSNDNADAISMGLASLTATGLHTVEIDEAAIALRALVEHRDDPVTTRTQIINRLYRG